jgi:hypothetical protein
VPARVPRALLGGGNGIAVLRLQSVRIGGSATGAAVQLEALSGQSGQERALGSVGYSYLQYSYLK